MQSEIIDPLSANIKRFKEISHSIREEGKEYTKQLQQSFSELKRATQTHIDSQSSTQSKMTKIMKRKASIVPERTNAAYDSFILAEKNCREQQLKYYSEHIPSLETKLKSTEIEKQIFAKSILTAYKKIETNFQKALEKYLDSQDLETINLASDADKVLQETKSDEVPSVRTLQNPLAAQRIMVSVKQSSIKQRYCVLTEKSLYVFDSEDSTTPKYELNLKQVSCHDLHESVFRKENCFQLVHNSTCYYFLMENSQQKIFWMDTILEHSSCCSICETRRQFITSRKRSMDSVDTTMSPEDFIDFHKVRKITMKIAEAKGLPQEELFRKDSFYVNVLINGLLFARTWPIQSPNPFWSDEIVIE